MSSSNLAPLPQQSLNTISPNLNTNTGTAMAGPEFIVTPATPADVDALVAVYYAAFGTNPFNGTMFPLAATETGTMRPSMHLWLVRRFLGYFEQSDQRFFKVTETCSGKIVSWARWTYPHAAAAGSSSSSTAPADKWPPGADIPLCETYFGALDASRLKWADASRDFVLAFLSTDPAYGRRGLGRLALESVLKGVDAEGGRVYLEATAQGRGLYARLGWEVVDVLEVDFQRGDGEGEGVELYKNWVMIREPKGRLR